MSLKVLSGIAELDRGKWALFIEKHPFGTVFQSPEMFDLYASVSSYSPIVLALEDDKGKIKALVLAVIIQDYNKIAGSMTARTLIYGGPLLDSGDKHQEQLLEQILDALVNKVEHHSLYIQIRNLNDYSVFDPVFRTKGFNREDHLNLIVPTSQAKETLQGISKSKQRQAKQSLNTGATLTIADNEADVIELYRMLEKLYNSRVKKPLPPLSFFKSFFRASQEGKLGMILLAKYEGKVVGGMVCPLTSGKALFEWYICGMDKEFAKIHPSVLLTYGAIEYALLHEIPAFDFMGIGSPDVPYGVRDFKTRFGGKTVNYGRYLRVNNKVAFTIAKTGFDFLGFLRRMFGRS